MLALTSPGLVLALLLTLCFGLAAWLEPRHQAWTGSRRSAANLLEVILGDSRRLFANHFFVKADVYFHSGYYRSVFDSREAGQGTHIAKHAGSDAGQSGSEGGRNQDEHEHEEECELGANGGFLGPPRDWIDRFGRHFYPSRHTHLDEPTLAREILPWLRLSASLDPQRVETYTVASYWLRQRLNRPEAAAQFLLEGWRANPDSYEILFELGRLHEDSFRDHKRARNLQELALQKFLARKDKSVGAGSEDSTIEHIVGRLARLEERDQHWGEAIKYLEMLKTLSPHPDLIQKRIDDAKSRIIH